ncbi:MAG: Gfo/Idh/MocA family oxidoreductase [Candidatus Sumerlaeota bacterium]|nr:Gfo/Idh/MocA family oxidoreductase [Candidatus Sumerlaeota bacterium]
MRVMHSINRRVFLKEAAKAAGAGAAILAAPAIIPASALGADKAVAPSNRIGMGIIGTGNQGLGELGNWLGDERVQVLAVCDVNRESPGYWGGVAGGREVARKRVEDKYAEARRSGKYKGCEAYEDFRELLARPDIDAVYIATPDHWHAIIAIAAAKALKDIYGQKPLSLTIAEGRAMCDAVKRYGRVFQAGSQQRSDWNFRRACELVRNGRIGKLQTVRCGLPGGTPDYSAGKSVKTEITPVPNGFNYDLWLGPAPYAPYCPARCFVNFRWVFDYSGGQLTDWGGHHPDIAQWGMGTELSGPERIVNARAQYATHPIWNTATEYYFECIYKSGVKLIVSNKERGGVTFEGTDGKVWANRGTHSAEPKSLLKEVIAPEEIHLYESSNHFRNFIDCVISRREPVAPVEVAHRSISIAHLGNIAMRVGRDIRWNPDKEEIIGDTEAAAQLSRAFREPWCL